MDRNKIIGYRREPWGPVEVFLRGAFQLHILAPNIC